MKYWIKNISRNIGAVHQKSALQKKQSDTYYVVAMAILLVQALSVEKQLSPFATFASGGTHNSNIFLTSPISMLGVDDPSLR